MLFWLYRELSSFNLFLLGFFVVVEQLILPRRLVNNTNSINKSKLKQLLNVWM